MATTNLTINVSVRRWVVGLAIAAYRLRLFRLDEWLVEHAVHVALPKR